VKQVVVLAHELSKSYQVGTQVISVLHKVQASFMAGSSYAITGASGSGKSTLLHLLAGLDAPDSGTIERIVERFGILFQMPYLIDELSVMENIELQGLVAGMAKKEAREQTAKLLAQVGLQGLEDRRPSSLSGGQQHRASLVRALIGQPRLIFADEPTGNLDAETGTLILNLLLYYQQQHDACLIISTHDTSIMQAVDHVLRLENGILQQER
jgi:ABC-type lipoprotein export system ATPase subunit